MSNAAYIIKSIILILAIIVFFPIWLIISLAGDYK